MQTNLLDDLGISFGGEGRSLLDGPKYGNFGGKNHTGGKTGNSMPIDTSDRMYKQHDMGWAECEKLSGDQRQMCKEKEDKKLVDRLEGLPDDVNKWPYPPPKDLKKDAERFRDGAIFWFKKKK